ncbi:protein YgfX [Aquitalea denitrificans]|uniref:protein YgfX n=1 Tax=Aquitalea denitrificans TaxID=519081 RepID=UPI00135CD974|nr:protein YgfX [Aquitalea denitrificans]
MHKVRLLPPFALQLRPSRRWLGLVLASLCLSIVLLLIYLPYWSAMIPCQCLLAWFAVRANGWWNPHGVQRIEVDGLGRMRWQRDGDLAEVVLRDDSFVSPLFVIVNVMAAGRRRSCLLLPDSADHEALRQLRVYLLWFHPEAEQAAPAVLENP